VFTNVIIGMDPSDTSHEATRRGAELAKAFGAKVHLVTAFSDTARGGIEVTEERRKAEAMLESMAAEVDPTGRRVAVYAIPKRPPAAIVGVAEQVDADLVVIGNKGAHGARRVLGSVASAVINEAPCTVMVVKTT
jgi:nucleotide-binding universal stress UspA family protein